jgi:F-type H+-transporting ATPase subunit b
MISLDSSIIPAIIIFLALIAALNYILFKPLARILAERESRTAGLMAKAQEKTDHQLHLFQQYQASIKNARMEGYRRQEQLRAEGMKKRAEVLAQSRKVSEQMIQESRDSLHSQVEAAKQQLALDAQEIARRIASSILERSVAGASSS